MAAVLAVIGVAAGLGAITSPADGQPVVVAAHDIASGTVIGDDDLRVAVLPASATPQGAFTEVSDVVGRQALSDIPARDIVMESALLSADLTTATGLLKLPVHFTDSAAVSLLRSGQRIDIFGPSGSGGSSALVASNLPVLAIPQSDSGSAWGDQATALVVIEVTPDQAASLSSAAAGGSLSFALR